MRWHVYKTKNSSATTRLWIGVWYAGTLVTWDQASLFRGGKVRLIQLLDYVSVASSESGLFSDWSRNKRYLELNHNWFPVWQCDFRSKKSCELMNSIMTSDEVSKVLSKMNKCIHRIVCHERDVLAVLPTALAKSAIYQFISKVLFRLGRTANVTSTTTAEFLVFCWLTKCNGAFTKFCFWN